MTSRLPVLSASLLLAAGAAAQNAPPQGFLFNWDRPALADGVSVITRGSAGAETALNRIDRDDYREWGHDAQGNVRIRGFTLWIGDDDYTTPQTFGLTAHAEDPQNPNLPNPTPAFQVQNLPLPNGQPGDLFQMQVGLGAAVTVPGAGDVFVGVQLPAMTRATQPFDGLWLGAIQRFDPQLPAATIFDEPGPRGQQGAGIFRDSYLCFVVNGAPRMLPPSATSLAQLAIEVAIDNGQIGGVALAQTNQTSMPSSNAPFGTSNFLSGLHPDLHGFNPGRADDLGFGVTHHTGQLPIGSPVFFLLALGPSPIGSLPIASFAGVDPQQSAGSVCVDFTAAATFVGVSTAGNFANTGEAQLVLTLTPAVRAALAAVGTPLDFWWQAVALDATSAGSGLELRTSGCVIQHVQ